MSKSERNDIVNYQVIYGSQVGSIMEQIEQNNLNVSRPHLSGEYLNPDAPNPNQNYPRDASGESYDPREVMGIVRAFDNIRFPVKK